MTASHEALQTAEPARPRFASRHPLLAFCVLPLPVTLLVLAATGLVCALPPAYADAVFVQQVPQPVVAALVSMMAWSMRVVPFAVAAVLFTRAYVRSGASAWWFVAAAAQILLAAALFDRQIRSSTEPGQSSITMGFTLFRGDRVPLIQVLALHLLQVAVPVAVGTMMLQAARRRQAGHTRLS